MLARRIRATSLDTKKNAFISFSDKFFFSSRFSMAADSLNFKSDNVTPLDVRGMVQTLVQRFP